MEAAQFNALVERLSARAQRYPTLYKLQVLGLALIGYLYVFGMVFIALLFTAAVAVLCIFQPILLVKLAKVIWIPVVFAWTVLRAMWVRFDPPEGRVLTAAEVPRLFEEIESIRKQINGPRVHTVLLTEDYNASVVQIPRLGLLGWPRNCLIVGLPMMAAMSLEQFRAVLAHELGHLCAGDSRMTGRIYQQRILWARLQQQFEQRGSWAFRPFFTRFAPYFNAYSFVLARAQEYAADRASAQVAGPQAASEALVVAGLGAQYQSSQVWDPLWKRARFEEQPAQLPYASLLGSTRSVGSWNDAPLKLREALEQETDWSDTHPCLRDRLSALNVEPVVPASVGPHAAELLLGERMKAYASEFDEVWKLRVSGNWREHYRQSLVHRDQLAALEKTKGEGPLDAEQVWQYALLTEQVHDGKQALPLYRAFNAEHPQDSRGQFALGRLLLDDGDDAGLKLLDQAMDQDGEAIKPAAQHAYHYLMRRKRKEEAAHYEAKWQALNTLEGMAHQERAEFKPGDDYEAHGLSEANVVLLRDSLRGLGFVKTAVLVRKRVRYLPEYPAYLLFVKKRLFTRVSDDKAMLQIQQALNADKVTVAICTRNHAKLWKKTGKVAGSRLF